MSDPATFPVHRAFFGDQQRDFALTIDLIRELERLCECGFGLLCRRVLAGTYRLDDCVATLRLGLIGGGESPQNAAALVATYASARPISETLTIAIGILEATFAGAPSPSEKESQA